MKNYEVTLTATSCKTVTLSAESEKAAKKLAGDLYFSSDMLDFNNDDSQPCHYSEVRGTQ